MRRHILPMPLYGIRTKTVNVCPSQLKSDEIVIQIEHAFDTYLKRKIEQNTEIINIDVKSVIENLCFV